MKKILLVIAIMFSVLLLTGCTATSYQGLSSEELYNSLNKDGYKYINASTDDGVDRIIYSKGNVSFTKINSRGYIEKYPAGTTYYFSDESVNDKEVTLYGSGNKEQYNAYKKWLKEKGLDTDSMIELLDYIDSSVPVSY